MTLLILASRVEVCGCKAVRAAFAEAAAMRVSRATRMASNLPMALQ